MGFRFRKRSGLLGGLLHINWSKNGLSSISVGKPGATFNIPVARSGGTRTTVGLPGTGLSWSEQAPAKRSVQQRRQQQRPQQTSTEAIIDELMGALVGIDKPGDAMWRQGLIDRVLNDPNTPRKVRSAALLIKSPESCELHCRRARGRAATKRAALEVIESVQIVLAWTAEQGWSSSNE